MSDIVERLNGFCVDWDGSELPANAEPMDGIHCDVLLDAATEITRLRSELANARNAALEEAAALIDRTPICELQRTNEDRPDRIFEIAAGTQSIHDARLVRSLKAEGESR